MPVSCINLPLFWGLLFSHLPHMLGNGQILQLHVYLKRHPMFIRDMGKVILVINMSSEHDVVTVLVNFLWLGLPLQDLLKIGPINILPWIRRGS